jgi:hypothetical protein
LGRQRMVRPELFTHEDLFAAEKAAGLPLRLAFIGLWTQCDREGRFEWRPLRLKLAVLPWDEVDFTAILAALADAGFVKRYEADGRPFGFIPSWHRHQKPHHQEAASVIPCPQATDSHEGATLLGESPKAFGPSPEAIRSISPGDGDGDGDGGRARPAKNGRPTIEEVRAYCLERGKGVDPEAWFDHYTANGWKVGKNPMKDWRAAVRTWERNGIHSKDKASVDVKPRVLTPEEMRAM